MDPGAMAAWYALARASSGGVVVVDTTMVVGWRTGMAGPANRSRRTTDPDKNRGAQHFEMPAGMVIAGPEPVGGYRPKLECRNRPSHPVVEVVCDCSRQFASIMQRICGAVAVV